MRRADREITDHDKITTIIESCYCCRLGFHDAGKVYIVPLSFGCEEKDRQRIFYFHGAKKGRKIDLIVKNQYAGFELDTSYGLDRADTACGHSVRFQSVIGSGKISFIEDVEEKKHALQCIMLHCTGQENWVFSEAALEQTAVFKLIVEELSCKEHK